MQPFLSIVIPIYNSQNSIVDTINSCLNQTYKHFEIIIIDDGSTDQTLNILAKYSNNNIKVITREGLPKGGNSCRNIGLNISKGEYIIFLDSDDLLEKNCIKQRIKVMQEDSSLDFAIFKVKEFHIFPEDLNNLAINISSNDHLKDFVKIKYPYPWHTCSPIWKKSFLVNLGGFNLNYSRLQDPELHTRALLVDGVKYRTCFDYPVDSYYRIPKFQSNIKLQKVSRSFLISLEMFLTDFIPKIKTYDYKYNRNISSALNETIWNIFKNISVSFNLLPLFVNILKIAKANKIIKVQEMLYLSSIYILKTIGRSVYKIIMIIPNNHNNYKPL
ncbi:glycosyltransferase family 2 protein [Spirosoma gilvum]